MKCQNLFLRKKKNLEILHIMLGVENVLSGENSPNLICWQRMSRSNCASTQSDHCFFVGS